MSKVTIEEYEGVATPEGITAQLPRGPVIKRQTITFTGTAGVSEPFDPRTKIIYVCPDADASVVIGSEADATDVGTDDALWPGKVPQWRAVAGRQFLGARTYA